MKYTWLLLDADGTVFDFDRAAKEALAAACQQSFQHFEPSYEAIYEQINTRMWQAFEAGHISQELLRIKRFEVFFEAINVSGDPDAFGQFYLCSLAADARVFPGTEGVIRQLAERTNLMIITNGLKEVQRPRFARASINECFADFIISEEVGAAKPDVKIFDEAFRRMNHPQKSDVLMVGDSLTSDIKGGNNYGIDTCWFNPAGRKCDQEVAFDYEIGDLAELLPIVL